MVGAGRRFRRRLSLSSHICYDARNQYACILMDQLAVRKVSSNRAVDRFWYSAFEEPRASARALIPGGDDASSVLIPVVRATCRGSMAVDGTVRRGWHLRSR